MPNLLITRAIHTLRIPGVWGQGSNNVSYNGKHCIATATSFNALEDSALLGTKEQDDIMSDARRRYARVLGLQDKQDSGVAIWGAVIQYNDTSGRTLKEVIRFMELANEDHD